MRYDTKNINCDTTSEITSDTSLERPNLIPNPEMSTEIANATRKQTNASPSCLSVSQEVHDKGNRSPHNKPVMGPGQFSTQCVAFFKIGVSKIKLPEVPEVGHRESLAELVTQASGKLGNQLLAIPGSFTAASPPTRTDPGQSHPPTWLSVPESPSEDRTPPRRRPLPCND